MPSGQLFFACLNMKLVAPKLVAITALAQGALSSDISLATQQRLSVIVGATTGATSISAWLSTLGSDGKWPDSEIDYTAGCSAQTASWPAQSHWSRINTFAAGWHGGLKNAEQFVGNSTLRAAISSAMLFWFDNDFTDPSCLDYGGTDLCPCSTPGLWNTNWDSNIILIPGWVGKVCLLLGDSLAEDESAGCQRMTSRTYGTFLTGINGLGGGITGANLMDIASIGIDLGLSTANASIISDAYNRVHQEITVKNTIMADGIRADGSFGQHVGLLYNGNYGKDYANDVFNLELTAAGTAYQASDASRTAFISLVQGDQWAVFKNTFTNVLHWDFSVLGRIISLPVADDQATENLKINLTQIQALGQLWGSPEISDAFNSLSVNSTTANIGSLNGNRMFYANDYMVQRGPGYVTTLKMYSNRTSNSECLNLQNPFGFHLSDGTTYTYVTGDEYEDIFPAWDWNLIPGTTVDYDATPLSCDTTRVTGIQSFVGGASNGSIGVAAMRYENPTTQALSWHKTWFFIDDIQFVMVAGLKSATDAPVFSVLQQQRQNGPVYVDGEENGGGNFSGISTLWHDGVGYAFNSSDSSTSLSVSLNSNVTGSWQTISTSSKPPVTVDLFAAWLHHIDLASPVSYAVFPATGSPTSFQQKLAASQLNVVQNDESISALLDANNNIAMVVFWDAYGGSVTVPSTVSNNARVTISADGNSIIIVDMTKWNMTVADPSQSLASLGVSISLGYGTTPASWASQYKTANYTIELPSGGITGSSVQQTLF